MRSTEQQSPEANTGRRGLVRRLHWVKRWMYRGGRPRTLAQVMNRAWVSFIYGTRPAAACSTCPQRA